MRVGFSLKERQRIVHIKLSLMLCQNICLLYDRISDIRRGRKRLFLESCPIYSDITALAM